MKRLIYFILISTAVLVLFLLKINNHNLWIDEAYSLCQSGKNLNYLLITIFQQDPHPPLYYIMLKLWCAFFGISITAGLCFSLFFSLLSILAGIYLCRMIFSDRSAVIYIMLFLVVTSPFYIMFSRMVRYYSFVSFLVMICLIFFIKYLNSYRKRWWFFLLLAHILIIYTDYPASTIFLGEFCSVLVLKKYRNKILGLMLIFFITAIAFIPWTANLFYNINYLAMLPGKTFLSGKLSGVLLRIFFSLYDFCAGECIYPWKFYITVPVILTYLYIIKKFFKYKGKLLTQINISVIVVLLVLSVSIVSVAVLSNYFVGKQSFIYTPSRLMFCFIPVMAIISYVLSGMGKKGYFLIAVIFVCNCVSLYFYYSQDGFINPVYIINWNKAVDDIKAQLTGSEILISDESEVLRFYAKNKFPDSLFFYDETQLKQFFNKNEPQTDNIKFVIFKTQRDSTNSGMFSKNFLGKLIEKSQVVDKKAYTPVSDTYIRVKKYFGAQGYKYKMKVITVLADKQTLNDYIQNNR